jgi:hypothetical protein
VNQNGVAGPYSRLKRVDEVGAICAGVVRGHQAVEIRFQLRTGIVARINMIDSTACCRSSAPLSSAPSECVRRLGCRRAHPDRRVAVGGRMRFQARARTRCPQTYSARHSERTLPAAPLRRLVEAAADRRAR